MLFNSLIGQQQTSSQLVDMVRQNRLSHALLFLAKEGSGGLPLALAFSQYVVCEQVNRTSQTQAGPSLFGDSVDIVPEPVLPADACGVCNACKKAAEMVHPDIHYSYPVIPLKSGEQPVSTDYIKEWREFVKTQPYANAYDWLQFINAENKQGNITAKECEEIVKKMSLKSFEARYKILIIWMPEMLGKEGNKLLKLIEEPPPDSLFLLVAENESLILSTILSRTQLIKIPALAREDIFQALISRENLTAEKAGQIAAISNGNYHEALQLLQHADDDWETLLRDWLNSIVKSGPVAQVKWIEEISKTGREKQKRFLKYFIHLLHHCVRIRAMGADIAARTESPETHDFALRINKLCNISQQEAMVKELDDASYYVERNANAKILFHALPIKMYHIISNKSVILMG